jgi:hypothetical protein
MRELLDSRKVIGRCTGADYRLRFEHSLTICRLFLSRDVAQMGSVPKLYGTSVALSSHRVFFQACFLKLPTFRQSETNTRSP